MPPSAESRKELQRYMALTLSVDEAVIAQRWDDLDPLLAEREASLVRLEKAGARFSTEELDKVQAVELRVAQSLRKVSNAIGATIRSNVASDKAGRVYGSNGRSARFGFSQAS